ncbi:MAG: LssY C-terminal domain-containing protein, partial [Candidatus Omnitrophica bacterium]|nr:LssY C-terminal domain-containing protein [Candidatus Omnitrophota bacterium]
AYIARVKPGIRLFDRPFLRLLLPVGFIVMPVDHFFVRSANEVMRETFASNALRYGWIHPGEEKSGFVFLPQELGTRHVTLDLYGDEIGANGPGLKHFSFFVNIPGINPDYRTKTLESYYAAEAVEDIADEAALKKALEKLRCCVTNRTGTRAGDPVNLVVIGTLDDLLAAFTAAKWDETEVASFRSVIKMIKAFLSGKPYEYSPFSPLFLYGRSQDIGIRKARSIHERMHLRLWYSSMRYQGRPVWVGQVSRDIGVRFTLKTWNFMTHKIDPDVDEAALYVLSDLLYQKGAEKYGVVGGGVPSAPDRPVKNLTGDPYFTSGKRMVLLLPDREKPAPEVTGKLFGS